MDRRRSQIDCSGKPAVNAPKWAFNANIEQTVDFDDYKLVLQGGTRWRGDYYVASTYQPWLISRSAFQSRASITFSPQSDRYFISAFINNIEDKRRIVLATTSAINTLGAITTDPRTFGVRAGVRFR